MKKHKYDVIVVGGGIIGLSIAYHLLKKNSKLKVAVFESRYFGRGGSTRNAGHFRVHFWTKENTVYAKKSVEMILKFARETGWNPTIHRSGYLWLIGEEDTLEAFKRYDREIWRPLGVGVSFLDIGEVSERYRYLNLEGFISAVYAPQDGKLHHDILVYGYMDGFRRRGGELHIYTPVLSIKTSGGKVSGIDIGTKVIEAENIVVAAGDYTDDLLSPLNIDLPIELNRKELYVSEPYKYFIEPLIIDTRKDSEGLYISQTLRGEVMGSIDYPEVVGDREYNTSLKHYTRYVEKASRLLPSIGGMSVMRVWSGNYVSTVDRSHIIGRDDHWPRGLYVATGFSGHGLMMAAYTGYLMAKHIIDGDIPNDMKPFTPSRFKYGRLINESLVIG